MNDILIIVLVLAFIGAALLAVAAPISVALVRLRAQRLPTALALRMEEEWSSELNSISSRPGKLAFAVALLLTRRRAFVAPGEDIVSEIAAFGSRKSLVVLSTLVFAIAAYGASFLLPVRYESEALLQIKDRGDLVLRQARSNSLFASVVDEMPKGGAGSRERMTEDLRENTTVIPLMNIDPSGSGTLFMVRYLAPDPATAQNVTEKLTTRLMEQDMAKRFEQSHEEEKFLQDQLGRLAAQVEDKGEELALLRSTQGPAAGRMLALDHELLVSSYKAMFAKYQDAQMSATLQPSRFAVVDPPQLGREVVPNRAAYAGIGALAGLAMGGMTVVGLGRRQRRLLTKVV